MNPSFRSSSADEQAATWAARLESGSFGHADRTELEQWLTADERHRLLLADYCQFSADLETVLPTLLAEGRIEAPAPRRARPSYWRSWAGFGTLAAAALAVGFFTLTPSAPTTGVNRLATAASQRESIMLADGSRVELNARTSIEFLQTRHERRVRLADGQAFFTVSKDPSRPFTVETPAGSVRVTGTRFDVRADSTAPLEVTVEEGSVQVRLAELSDLPGQTSTYRLAADQRLSLRPEGVTVQELSSAETANLLAWREGFIVFEGVTLSEALARFSRYHGRGMTAAADAASFPVGGRHSLDDLDGFFSSIEEVLPVRVTHDLSGNVTVRLRPDA